MSLLWLFVVLIASVLLHELGHAIAAWAGGYRVTSFGIGSGKPLLLLRLPRTRTLFYVCRFGLRFSGVTWVFYPKGAPSRGSDLLLACGGALTNAAVAIGAAGVLASFELHSVPFLSVWVPAVVVLVVNSVLALSFFVPHRTLSAAQGTLTSDGLQVLATLFPTRFRTASLANITAPLRTLAQRRAFWESIGDQTMLCVALVRAAEAYYEVGDLDAARACWEESASLAVMPGVAPYQRAWNHLLAVRLAEGVVRSDNLDKAEAEFHAAGNRAGILMVARERVMRFDSRPLSDRDVLLATLQAEAMALGDAPQALYILADRIDLQGALLHGGGQSGDKHDATGLTVLERLASQYDAARVGLESSVADIQVYSQIASARSAAGDDGGAAIAYERALAAARRIYLALAFSPETQRRFAARQVSLVRSAMDCCRRLGRESDAARYAHLLT